MQAILFDLDGVLYQGEQAITGAANTLAWVRAQAIPHLFITNTSSRPRSAIVEKLARMGIEVTEEEILSPAVAAAQWIRQHLQGEVALFIPPATQAEFSDLPLLAQDREQGAAAVVIGDLGTAWDFATLNRAFRLLMAEPRPRLIALGMTRYWRAADGLRLDTAPFVVALQHASGVEPLVLGKPALPLYQSALELLGSKANETLMVGDDIRGDIDGAQQAGLHGMLVQTGKFSPRDLQQGIEPYASIDSIALLPEWWERHKNE